MKLEALIFCHNFQRRLCWVLSSFIQQNPHPFELSVNISCTANNGTPTTEEVARYFSSRGLPVTLSIYDQQDLAYPSLLKNDQFKRHSDYFLCHSSDHVLRQDYLEKLAIAVEKYPDVPAIGCGEKVHTDREATDAEMQSPYCHYVSNVFERAWNIKRIGRRVRKGVGGHFLINKKALVAVNGGIYVKEKNCRDRHLFKKGMKTRSDPGFRRNIGGVKNYPLPPMVHLNHSRDKEEGHHLEEQR